MTSLSDIFKKNKTDKYDHKYAELYESILSDKRDQKINMLEIGVFFGLSHIAWSEYFDKGTIYGIDIFHPYRYSRKMKCYAYRPLNLIDEWDKIKPDLDHFSLSEWYGERISEFVNSDRIKLYRCSQSYIDPSKAIKQETSICERGLGWFIDQVEDDLLFDIIVDDGSHRQSDHQISLGYLFKQLKPGGVYIIEDAQFEKYNKYLSFDNKKAPMTIDLIDQFNELGEFNSPCISEEEKNYLKRWIDNTYIHTVKNKKGEKLIIIHKKNN